MVTLINPPLLRQPKHQEIADGKYSKGYPAIIMFPDFESKEIKKVV